MDWRDRLWHWLWRNGVRSHGSPDLLTFGRLPSQPPLSLEDLVQLLLVLAHEVVDAGAALGAVPPVAIEAKLLVHAAAAAHREAIFLQQAVRDA